MTYNNNETALLDSKIFLLPDAVCDEFSSEELAEDFEGLQLSFQRMKIPGGGNLMFEVPGDDPENPDYVKTIEGVILYHHPACAYWAEGEEYNDNAVPLCSSVNGKIGIGTPGGICEDCDFNQYGTDVNGKGKACKNMRNLYILRSGEYMPVLLSLPPTSLRPFSDFMNMAFLPRHRPAWSAVVQIGLKRMDNGSNTYSVATFKKLFDFTGEELQQVRGVAESFREQIKNYNQQRATATENRTEQEGVYEVDASYTETGSGDHFCIEHNAVDGSRDELPA